MSDRHFILDSITSAFVPIHREGHKFILGFAVAALILFILAWPLGWLGIIVTLACAYFYRDPERVTPARSGLAVSSGDGKIVTVGTVAPPKELALGEVLLTRVSVFLSVLDVHVVRALIAGLIARRIVTFVGEGTSVAAGERIGLIRFGSRVDVYLPANAEVLVATGQTAIGGETVLAELPGARMRADGP